jgi:hypothetical protein
MTRQEANLEIVKKLEEFFSKPEHKDVRFFQGLTSMNLFVQQYDDRLNVTGIEDPFFQESVKTLEIVNKSK